MEPVTFEGSTITVGGRSWDVPHPVHDARWIDGRIIVIYKYGLGQTRARTPWSTHDPHPFHNVEAFDDAGRKLWTAENPSRDNVDAYDEFMSEEPLILWNFACCRCTIDPATGKLLKAEWSK